MMRGTYSITKQFGCFTVLSVLLMIVVVGQAEAGPSYTTTMSFYQGFDLEEGTVDKGIKQLLEEGTGSPDVIRLVFVLEDVEPEEVYYRFEPSVDFQIGYDEEHDFFGFLPHDFTVVAIMENSAFESIDTINLNALDFSYDPTEIRFDPDYTLIALTADDHFFKLGNFSKSGSTVGFDWERIEANAAVPEPSTLILISVGIIGIGLIVKRKRKKHFLVSFLIVFAFTLTLNIPHSLAWNGFTESIADYAENNYTNGGSCPSDYGISCAGFVKKVLRDVTGIEPDSGWVPEGWDGKPGYPEPLQRVYEAQQVYWPNVTRGDIVTNTYSDTGHIAIVSEKTNSGILLTHCTTYGNNGIYRILVRHSESGGWMRNGTEKFWRIGTPKGSVKIVEEIVKFPLGGVDLNAYCRQRGYAGVHLGNPNDAGSWKCLNSSCGWSGYDSSSNGMSVTQACREQYGDRYAWAEAGNWGDAYSWGCYTKRSFYVNVWFFRKRITYTKRLGGVNMRGFCQKPRSRGSLSVNGQRLSVSTKYRDVIHNPNDAGSWRCSGKSVYQCSNSQAGISVTDACREQKRNSNAYALALNWNDAFSWQCYVDKVVTKTVFQSVSTSASTTAFSVTVNKSGTGSGTVEAKDIACGPDCNGGEYPIGSFVDLKAIPAAGSMFAGWQVNGQPANRAIPVSSSPVTMTAKFDKKPETTPVVTGVSPNPMPRKSDWSRQWMTIYGRNFQPGAKLLFKIVGTQYVYPDRVPNYISSTELRYYISVGPNVYDWTVEVINPDRKISNAYGFQVR